MFNIILQYKEIGLLREMADSRVGKVLDGPEYLVSESTQMNTSQRTEKALLVQLWD